MGESSNELVREVVLMRPALRALTLVNEMPVNGEEDVTLAIVVDVVGLEDLLVESLRCGGGGHRCCSFDDCGLL